MEYNRWTFLLVGYILTAAIELPILMLGLSSRHSWKDRLFAGIWVNACSYPIVVLVLPEIFHDSRTLYLVVAETFAPVSECLLFWAAFGSRAERWRRSMWRDFAVITLANLASFGGGELVSYLGWWNIIFRSN
ncbi:MAG TPA: hypothetical protein VGZ47_09805 [Gemmataceae bacterium]|jgi:hypothetical protein|nr:hypothetical protein [Gemmataceae bacterium]